MEPERGPCDQRAFLWSLVETEN